MLRCKWLSQKMRASKTLFLNYPPDMSIAQVVAITPMYENTPLLPTKSQLRRFLWSWIVSSRSAQKGPSTSDWRTQVCAATWWVMRPHLDDLSFPFQRWVHSQSTHHAFGHRILCVGARHAVCFLNASLKHYTTLIFLFSCFYMPSSVIRERGWKYLSFK